MVCCWVVYVDYDECNDTLNDTCHLLMCCCWVVYADYDECKDTPKDNCHFCHNTNGSYFCTCNEGYVVVNRIYCEGIVSYGPFSVNVDSDAPSTNDLRYLMYCSACVLRVIAFDREGYAIVTVHLLICSCAHGITETDVESTDLNKIFWDSDQVIRF